MQRSIRCSILFLSASILFAQASDWQAVQKIPWGSHIAIKTGRGPRIHCEFDHASDREMFCEDGPVGLFPRPLRHILRERIRQVRLENPGKGRLRGALLGSLIGGSVCSLLGATSNDAETRVVAPEVGVLLGGLGGALVGQFLPPQGPIIYQNP